MTPATILLVLDAGDKHGLLADGGCGSRVPMLHRVNGGWVHLSSEEWCFADARALVLAYQGKPVAEGMNRAREVLARVEGVTTTNGLIWTHGSQMKAWVLVYDNTLGGMIRYGVTPIRPSEGWKRWEREVSGLGDEMPAGTTPTNVHAWSLGVTLAARLNCRLVLLDSDGREVTP